LENVIDVNEAQFLKTPVFAEVTLFGITNDFILVPAIILCGNCVILSGKVIEVNSEQSLKQL
jgi:hypothetical protein